ncbi:proteasome subunit beta [Nakamurella antarctica]|uniref:Proteasome subunit beta n=1 Tax=Nakamurella antarctica TaxID=1902245 RepID=A0A3G8ZKS1_9ACTN|nr:proteasome subunit beta [Nakamurella antarctica]AZI57912.1 proteasome subunit beta [Nakamurella antarctica]
MTSSWPASAVPAAYLTPGTGSFTEFLALAEPRLLPGGQQHKDGVTAGTAHLTESVHGTTIVAVTFADGVVIAGDRRATMGSMIAQRDIEKVFIADNFSAIGIAGTAGIAVEMVRLFQLELEHYEKIEGVSLSLDGKANRLATMIRGNLGAAMQGLAVVPLFAGFDVDRAAATILDPEEAKSAGRIFAYDVVGGKYEEHDYHAVGSGSVFAKSALKKRHQRDADQRTAVKAAVEALYDAADDDSATGGPDINRRIYPIVVVVGARGAEKLPSAQVALVAQEVVAGRQQNPGG